MALDVAQIIADLKESTVLEINELVEAIDEDERTEVEVVADTALLIVDGGMLFHLAVLHRIVVAI